MKKKVFIPKNLDISKLVLCNPPTIDGFSIEKLLLVVSFISEVAYYNNKNISPEGYVRLHSTILQSNIHNYKEYLNYLVINEVIIVDRHYMVGQKCRGYKFTDKYISEVLEETIEIKTHDPRRNNALKTFINARNLYNCIFRN